MQAAAATASEIGRSATRPPMQPRSSPSSVRVTKTAAGSSSVAVARSASSSGSIDVRPVTAASAVRASRRRPSCSSSGIVTGPGTPGGGAGPVFGARRVVIPNGS